MREIRKDGMNNRVSYDEKKRHKTALCMFKEFINTENINMYLQI